MNVVWKYELDITDLQRVTMPDEAEILTVQVQGGTPYMWARVNPNAIMVDRWFATHGTGRLIPETTDTYIGSYQIESGVLVFHVFEATNE